MSVNYRFISLIALIAGVPAQVFEKSPCPAVEVEQNFDVSAYLGKWYEVEKFPAVFESGDCIEATYGPVDADGNVGVLNKEVLADGRVNSVNGSARLVGSSGEGKLIVTLNTPKGVQSGSYWVLGTNYTDYSLVWSCENTFGQNSVQFSWVLSRTRELSTSARSIVDQLIADNGINKIHYRQTTQSGCTDLP